MRCHTVVRSIRDAAFFDSERELTLLEKCLNMRCLSVHIAALLIVQLRVVDHQTEVSLEGLSVFVQTFFKFGAHSTEIHGVLDHIKVTAGQLWVNMVIANSQFSEELTLGHDHGWDQQAVKTGQRAYLPSASSKRCGKPSRPAKTSHQLVLLGHVQPCQA